jgi:hypothetical protein
VYAAKQEIMEKFEFLPIKCRTERARQMYSKNQAACKGPAIEEGKKPLKSKVSVTTHFCALE